MIYISLTLILLSITLILISPINARILAGTEMTVELEYFFIKVVLSDFANKKRRNNKQMPISPLRLTGLILKAIRLSTVKINTARVDISSGQTELTYNRIGVIFALLYPTVATLFTSSRDTQIQDGAINLNAFPEQENKTHYNFDIVLSAPLFTALRLLLWYLHEYIIHKRRKGKWRMR